MSTQQKIIELEKISQEIKSFKGIDIAKDCTHAVPGEGNPDAQVMFIGEAPGFHEDQQGRPFVGQAGKLLEKSLSEIGLKREEVYITNIVKFRPPENRDPFPEEIEACKEWLDRQISIISPQIIATLGRFSMAKFFGPQSISRIHGQHRKILWKDVPVLVFPMYHPAAALRAGEVMREFINDFQKLSHLLKSPPPTAEPLIRQDAKSTASEIDQTSLF